MKIQLMTDLTTMPCMVWEGSTYPVGDMRNGETNVTQQGGCCWLNGSHFFQLAAYGFSSCAPVQCWWYYFFCSSQRHPLLCGPLLLSQKQPNNEKTQETQILLPHAFLAFDRRSFNLCLLQFFACDCWKHLVVHELKRSSCKTSLRFLLHKCVSSANTTLFGWEMV